MLLYDLFFFSIFTTVTLFILGSSKLGSYECVYYVMLYMRNIIVDASLLLNNVNISFFDGFRLFGYYLFSTD